MGSSEERTVGGTALVTGGNAGLGYHCARTLLSARTWHVVIASRNPTMAEHAVARLRTETGNANDLVRRFVLDTLLPPMLEEARSSDQSYDVQLARDLWSGRAVLVGLSSP